MGLFDDVQDFNPTGGLLGRLIALTGVQNQYQPTGEGFPSNPMDANAFLSPQPQPQQNQPIAVGNYMMPRIGGGFPAGDGSLPQQTPDERANGQLPAAMQPQAAAQPPQALPPQLQPPSGNPFLRLAAGLHSVAQGGSLYGAITGNPDDPRSIQQQNLRAQYSALVPVLGPQRAMLAILDPEAHKTLVAQALGPQTVTPLGNGFVWDARQGKAIKAYEPDDKNKVVKIGQDGLGREQYGVFNPSDGSIKPYKAPGNSSDTGGGLGNMDLQGKDYLTSIPSAQRGIVQGVVEGTIAPPSSFALGKPYWQNILQAAKNYDPTFDATNWSGRVAGVKDFSAGKSSEMVRSANQTLHHTGALLDSMDALNNGSYPLINKAGNAINEASGGGAPTAFRLNAHAVAEEMSKVFKGANLSDTEIKSWEQNLSENMSPEQQRAAIGKLRDLLQGSLQALDEKRVASIGQMAADKAGPIIKPEGQRVLDRIETWLQGDNAGKGGAAPTASKTRTGIRWSVQ